MCIRDRFSDALAHRDFLGALMSLGVRRSVLGDICIQENTGYLFCLDTISDYIIDSLREVRRTSVRCSLADPPAILIQPQPPALVNVASQRLDAVICGVYRLPRSLGKEMVEQGLVYVNSRLAQNASRILEPGVLVSVRGKGRFLYEGMDRETRKGRLKVQIRPY